jgi:hypothetical protein
MLISLNDRGKILRDGAEQSQMKRKRTASAVLFLYGGAYEDRTHDLQIANLALSQLS